MHPGEERLQDSGECVQEWSQPRGAPRAREGRGRGVGVWAVRVAGRLPYPDTKDWRLQNCPRCEKRRMPVAGWYDTWGREGLAV